MGMLHSPLVRWVGTVLTPATGQGILVRYRGSVGMGEVPGRVRLREVWLPSLHPQ